MNMKTAKNLSVSALVLVLSVSFSIPAQASPWTKKEGYWNKTGGKFVFGLKHSLFSWTSWWTESREPQYKKEWHGFNVGLGKTVVYTATGLIQLVTFFIPVDVPNIGIGLHIPNKECPHRHDENYSSKSSKKAEAAPVELPEEPPAAPVAETPSGTYAPIPEEASSPAAVTES